MPLATIQKSAAEWRELLRTGFAKRGLAEDLAEHVAEALVEAELWGRSTHGLMRVPQIVKALDGGLIGRPRVASEGTVFAQVDGAGCLGYVVSALAVDLAARKARAHGLAVVGARNSSHNGMLGYYVWRLAQSGLVGFSTTHCAPSVAAFGAAERLLGTNPLAFSFPAADADDDPVVIDLATSAISYGEVERRRRYGEPLPEGVALDSTGAPTTDPTLAKDGFFLPFGSPGDEGKGSALGLAVELLSSVVVGASPLPSTHSGYGHFFLALQPELLNDTSAYASGWEKMVTRIRGLRMRPGRPPARLPGARAFARRQRGLREGLAIDSALWAELQAAL